MPRPPRPLPTPLLAGPFTRRSALLSGTSPGRLRRSDVVRPFTGVYDTVPEPDLARRCAAALTVLPHGSVLSHGTALRLMGVDLPRTLEDDDDVHVHLPPGSGRVRRRGITVHHTGHAVPFIRHAGLPVVTPARAWCDVATTVGGDDLVVVGDALLRRRQPCTTLESLGDEVASVPLGARGRRRLLDALPLLRPRTDSPMETRTRLVLVHAGLPCPRVNEPVRDSSGVFLVMPDLVYLWERIAIEYDGDVHRTDRRLWQQDVERRELLQDLGWLVIVVTADMVLHHPEVLVRRVRAALRARRTLAEA